MLNKRGYSFGAEFPIHYENVGGRWEVFDARTDVVLVTADEERVARDYAYELNGSPKVDLEAIDGTP